MKKHKVVVRNGVFETNSSSTHSICIAKKSVEIPVGKKIRFRLGEYGWENDTVYDTASYLYTAMTQLNMWDELRRLAEILDKWGVDYDFEIPKMGPFGLECGGIDHVNDLTGFISAVMTDETLLAKYLFGDSFINTGNDNQDADYEGCNIADEKIYDWDTGEYKQNPYHDEENYYYYEKGN